MSPDEWRPRLHRHWRALRATSRRAKDSWSSSLASSTVNDIDIIDAVRASVSARGHACERRMIRALLAVARRARAQIGAQAGFHELTVFELDIAVGEMEIAIIVRDDHHGLALRLQLGQQLAIEHVLEQRVLIGGPFVEQIERAILQIRDQQCEALALSLREFERGKRAVLDADLVIELQMHEQILRGLIEPVEAHAEQTVEQEEVAEHHRKQLPVAVAIRFAHGRAVHQDTPALGRVQPHDHLRERGLAAAVAADQIDQFAGLEAQIDRPEREDIILLLAEIAVRDAVEHETLEAAFDRRIEPVFERQFGVHFLDAFERHARRADVRNRRKQRLDRHDHVEKYHRVTRHHMRIHGIQARDHEQRDADEGEQDEAAPARRRRVEHVAARALHAHGFDVGGERVVDEGGAAQAMQLQFLGAVEQRAEVAHQIVLALARRAQVKQRASVGGAKTGRADADRHDRHQQNLPRQHAQIRKTADDDRALHRQRGHAHEQHHDGVEILREHGERARRALLLQMAERGAAQTPDRLHAQIRLGALAEVHEQRLRERARGEHDHAEHDELPAQTRELRSRGRQRLIDERDQARVTETADETGCERNEQGPSGVAGELQEQRHGTP
ncbi:hypothetical protein PT2222_320052 [Paraburkholderia tropica]